MAKHVGRHRAARYSALSELTNIAGESARPAVRATAVVAVSSGMLAGMIIPAQAVQAPSVDGVASEGSARPHGVTDVLGIAGTPTTDGPGLAPPAAAAPAAPAAAAPAAAILAVGPVVTAPASVAGLPTFGALGFTTKTVAVATDTRASRTTTTARTAPTAAPARVPAQSGSVIAVAASLLGIPYRYGGSSPSTGFDCSGFTSYVYRVAKGISIPRTAEGQRAGSTKVSNPVPGDLVFFGIPAGHVGIYAGNGMMYDSPHTGEVSQLRKIYGGKTITYGRF